ncbi:MAG: epoxyqueuosine reductase [Gammaproteobacteria bacterium]
MASIKPYHPSPPTYAFGYRHKPRSGNEINGLGRTEKTRASRVFHNAGDEPLEWQALDDFFGLINPWPAVRYVLANAWQLRNQYGRVSRKRVEVDDPEQMAAWIKKQALQLGASLVGITEVLDHAVYEERKVPFRNAIYIGLQMDRKEMQYAPQRRAAKEVMRTYYRISRIAVKVAKYIRKMGWQAKAYGNPNSTDILHIPHAINAGLGQLGKHGSMINREYGSNFRLAAVLTDLPMSFDQPVDIGVDDLCIHCRRCVKDCPPGAIADEKQMVRGVRKWYVDFDKCIPYFVKTFGCAICIEVCPWSEPGRGASLSRVLLAKRKKTGEIR